MATAGATSRPARIAQLAVGLLLAVKLYLAIASPPIGDEAYYWMWGQKLDWSYFDHPPLHAWSLRLMATLFGWNLFSLRILTWVTLAGILWIFWLWAKRLQPQDPGAWFWPTAAIYLAVPMFLWTGSFAFHDHLLTLLCLASGHAFLLFAEKYEATGRGFRWLYGAAALLGLAVLTKYNGVLLGLGVALFFAIRPPLRRLYGSPHIYLAALLSIAIQAPVLWWNAGRGFASYSFHLSERWGGNLFHFTPAGVINFAVITLLTLSPFLVPAIVGLLRRPLGGDFADRARQLAIATFAISTLVMGFLSFFINIFFYWNIVAFILMMPLLASWVTRRWIMLLHLGYGIAIGVAYAVHVTVLPLDDWTFQSTFGWDQIGTRIHAIQAERRIDFVATTRYTTAAQLGFALHDPEVTSIADRHDQYDVWFDPSAHAGQTALVVSDPRLGLAGVLPHFASVTALETIDIRVFGQLVYQPTIYLAEGFHGQPAAQ